MKLHSKATIGFMEDDTTDCAAGSTLSYPVNTPGKVLQPRNGPPFQKLLSGNLGNEFNMMRIENNNIAPLCSRLDVEMRFRFRSETLPTGFRGEVPKPSFAIFDIHGSEAQSAPAH